MQDKPDQISSSPTSPARSKPTGKRDSVGVGAMTDAVKQRFHRVEASIEKSWGSIWLSHLLKTVFWFALVVAILFAAAVAVTRFWLIPNADEFRPRIVESLSTLTGQRVAMESFEAGWNGWSPEIKINRLQMLDAKGRMLLELPRVESTISWRSLFLLEPRLTSLNIKGPRVSVRRTAKNTLTVAGMDVDLADEKAGDPALFEWLLRQRLVQIVGGEVVWLDDWRKLPPIKLSNVSIRLTNNGAEHRIGMSAVPPHEIASPLDVRAEFVGRDLNQVADWDGRAYVRVDYADLGRLTQYVPFPIGITRGTGGLQAWFDFDDGRPTGVTADLSMKNASLILSRSLGLQQGVGNATLSGSKLTPLDVQALSGRLSWQHLAANAKPEAIQKERWSMRDIRISTVQGVFQAPIDGELLTEADAQGVLDAKLKINTLDLAAITSITAALPVPSAVQEKFAVHKPEGKLDGLELHLIRPSLTSPTTLKSGVNSNSLGVANKDLVVEGVRAQFTKLGWLTQGPIPGVSGLNGSVSGGPLQGEIKLLGAQASMGVKPNAKVSTGALGEKATPLSLNFGDHFDAPWVFDSVSGRISWRQGEGKSKVSTGVAGGAGGQGLHIEANDIALSSAEITGTAHGTWDSSGAQGDLGRIDVSAIVPRAKAAILQKFISSKKTPITKRWLSESIRGGDLLGTQITVRGPLAKFPFAPSDSSMAVSEKNSSSADLFEIKSKLENGELDWGGGWPGGEKIYGNVSLRGKNFDALVQSAVIGGVPIVTGGAVPPIEVRIHDMGSVSTMVDIHGAVNAPLTSFQKFVDISPLKSLIGGLSQSIQPEGDGALTLQINIPLTAATRPMVKGDFTFNKNRMNFGDALPPLEDLTGTLNFTRNSIDAHDLSARILGSEAHAKVTSNGDRVTVVTNGKGAIAPFRDYFAIPFLDKLAGDAEWQLSTEKIVNESASSSGSARAASAVNPLNAPHIQELLPTKFTFTTTQPFGAWPLDHLVQGGEGARDAARPISVTITHTPTSAGREQISVELPAISAVIERGAPNASGVRELTRAGVNIGMAGKANLPDKGYVANANFNRLNIDAIIAYVNDLKWPASTSGAHRATLNALNTHLININVKSAEAALLGFQFNNVSLRTQPSASGGGWRLAIGSKEATGEASFDRDAKSGKVSSVAMHLKQFIWPNAMSRLPSASNAVNALRTPSLVNDEWMPTNWPLLDVVVDSFVKDSREFGRLELRAKPDNSNWQIDLLKLSNPDGVIEGKGQWRLANSAVTTANSQTTMDVKLKWPDAGQLLQRFGLPKGLEQGEGELKGQFSWPGSPARFAYRRLAGDFNLEMKRGKFTQMDPGMGKLLGVLSLQSIPRRLSLNFDDLFGKGFAFDEVKGDAKMKDGVASTDNFTALGSAARVQIRGTADLNTETQDLNVQIFPTLSTATAIGIGLATANPIIGAVALLGQKLAKDPIERILMQEFEIKGTFSAPDVKQIKNFR